MTLCESVVQILSGESIECLIRCKLCIYRINLKLFTTFANSSIVFEKRCNINNSIVTTFSFFIRNKEFEEKMEFLPIYWSSLKISYYPHVFFVLKTRRKKR